MSTMTAAERTLVAKKAARARWERQVPKAICGSEDRPLRIGEIELPCFVLEDGRRVLTQRGLKGALGLGTGGGAPRFLGFMGRIGGNSPGLEELTLRLNQPVAFTMPNGASALGYDAELLPRLCDVILEARLCGTLNKAQARIAAQCEVLVRALSKVGIIALVDEATGYEEIRARDSLARILEQFISKELRGWVRTFEPEFYKQMFRLHGWTYGELGKDSKRPMAAARVTIDVVYKRLAPGVLEKLREVADRDDKGRLKHPLHQRLSEHVGFPKLKEHLAAVTALMAVAPNKDTFYDWLDQVKPVYGDNLKLPFGPAAPTESSDSMN